MDKWHYVLALAVCLVLTAPLEFLGARVYREPLRTVRAVAPVSAVFVIWDVLAIRADVWTYNARYVTGVDLPTGVPVEELLFFVVIPLCGLLTYGCVEAILRRVSTPRRSVPPGLAR